eukprot:9497855-Pyramimonas_sp.AAC.2
MNSDRDDAIPAHSSSVPRSAQGSAAGKVTTERADWLHLAAPLAQLTGGDKRSRGHLFDYSCGPRVVPLGVPECLGGGQPTTHEPRSPGLAGAHCLSGARPCCWPRTAHLSP